MNGFGRRASSGPGFGNEAFDPEEIFNMFFHGGFGGTRYPFTILYAGLKPVEFLDIKMLNC